nr:unnamed protein product [Callosobruchus analis]
MAPLIQGKTLKQIRDRRRNVTYQKDRSEYLRSKGVDSTSVGNTDNESTERGSIDAGETSESSSQSNAPVVTEHQRIEGAGGGAPPPASISAAGDEHDEGTATPAVVIISPSPSLDNSARISELYDEEMVSPAVSPDEEVWRRDVAQTALSRQLTSAAKRHPEVNTVTQLLRNAISEARDLPGGLPQSQIDPLYDRVTALFVSEERGVAGRRKGHGRGKNKNKRGNRRYLFAMTQDIYKKNPGLLAKHVRNNVDWLEEPGVRAPAQDVRDLYQSSSFRADMAACQEILEGQIKDPYLEEVISRIESASGGDPDLIN